MTYNNVVLQVETKQALQAFEEQVLFQEEEQFFTEEFVEIFTEKIETIAAAALPPEEKAVEITAAVLEFEEKTETKVTKAEIQTASFLPPPTTMMEEKEEEKPAEIAMAIIEETEKETTNVREEKTSESKAEETKTETEEKVTAKAETKTNKTNTKVSKLEASMDKVDAVVKDAAKNLEVKSIIKLDAMQSDSSINLAVYNNQAFYKSKDIYLNQVMMFDNRDIYNNVTLVNYISNDPINIKENILHDINKRKEELLIEIEVLKNG